MQSVSPLEQWWENCGSEPPVILKGRDDFMRFQSFIWNSTGNFTEISGYTMSILLNEIKENQVCGIQLDETTDLAKMTHVIACVRYITKVIFRNVSFFFLFIK